MGVQHVQSSSELDACLSKPGLVIVDFSAEWCGPCKFIGPTFEKFSSQYTGATFVHVDIDHVSSHPVVSTIRSVPTFHFYKNGRKVSEFAGANEANLKSTIEANL